MPYYTEQSEQYLKMGQQFSHKFALQSRPSRSIFVSGISHETPLSSQNQTRMPPPPPNRCSVRTGSLQRCQRSPRSWQGVVRMAPGLLPALVDVEGMTKMLPPPRCWPPFLGSLREEGDAGAALPDKIPQAPVTAGSILPWLSCHLHGEVRTHGSIFQAVRTRKTKLLFCK